MPAQRRSRAEWQRLLDAFDAGEVPEAEFCAGHGISPTGKHMILGTHSALGITYFQLG